MSECESDFGGGCGGGGHAGDAELTTDHENHLASTAELTDKKKKLRKKVKKKKNVTIDESANNVVHDGGRQGGGGFGSFFKRRSNSFRSGSDTEDGGGGCSPFVRRQMKFYTKESTEYNIKTTINIRNLQGDIVLPTNNGAGATATPHVININFSNAPVIEAILRNDGSAGNLEILNKILAAYPQTSRASMHRRTTKTKPVPAESCHSTDTERDSGAPTGDSLTSGLSDGGGVSLGNDNNDDDEGVVEDCEFKNGEKKNS